MEPIFFRSGFNYDRDAASNESGLDCSVEKSLTQQHFAEEVDINTIVKRFGITGEMPQNFVPPTFSDFTGISDFKSAMDAVRQASESFMEMPAHVRARFGNDPQQLLEFVADEKNLDEAVKLGMAVKPPVASVAAPVAAPGTVAGDATAPVVAAPTAS